MQVIRADVLGMCFGVRDALEMMEHVSNPSGVTIHGELVHNEKVVDDLDARGFHMVAESRRRSLPMTDRVLITAHGVSEHERRRLLDAGKTLIDTTCPLVARAHEAAQQLQRDGYFVLVIGRPGHIEVQGIVEDLTDFEIVQHAEDVKRYPHSKLGVMCQTTTPKSLAEAVVANVRARNPHTEFRFEDTICRPTKEHQTALEDLRGNVDAMVVVGGKHSNNTRELVQRCRSWGIRTFHIQEATDIRREWFRDIRTVGLTAGTSTLDETIDDVEHRLCQIEPADSEDSLNHVAAADCCRPV